MNNNGASSVDFAAVYRAHFQGLRTLVMSYGVPAPEADDVAQEALIAVWRTLGHYDSERPLKPWLNTIAYRTARDYLEKQRWWRHVMRQPAKDDDLIATSPTPDELIATRQRRRVLSETLRSCSAVYGMAELDCLSLREIGQALGLSIATVKSRLRTARSEFAEAVSRYQARPATRR